MFLLICSALLALLAIILIATNWFIALKAVQAARGKTAYHVTQTHLLPELALYVAAQLWRTQLPLAQIGWFAFLLVIADVLSWVVAAKARPRTAR